MSLKVVKICDSCGFEFEDGDRAYFYKNKTFCPDCMYDELLNMNPAELIRLTDAQEFEFGEDF